MRRRQFLAGLLTGAALPLMGPLAAFGFEVTKSDEEWKKLLSPAAYRVLRHQDTEAPFTSPLNNEHRKGIFACAGCALDLFSSDTKFDSGTGWPSFFRPLPGSVQPSHSQTGQVSRNRRFSSGLTRRRSKNFESSFISEAL